MPVSIKEISVQNLGPHYRFSCQLGRFNLIYGHNENGKTFLVEFLIRALFKHAGNWQLRPHESRGKVTLSGLADRLTEFSPSSSLKLEDFWETTHPGLPPDFSRLLVVKGAEVDIAQVAGGIDKQILKRLLSNKAIFDQIENKISKTIRESSYSDGLISGPKRGEINTRELLSKNLRRLADLFVQIDGVFSAGQRRKLTDEKEKLTGDLNRLLQAKRYSAFKLDEEIKQLSGKLGKLAREKVTGLQSELKHYRQLQSQYNEKHESQKQAADASRHFSWLKGTFEVYQEHLSQAPVQPSWLLSLVATLFIVGGAVLSFVGLPVYAAGLTALALAVGGIYFYRMRAALQSAPARFELDQIRVSFSEKFGVELDGLSTLREYLGRLQEDFNNSRLLAKQLTQDSEKLRATQAAIEELFDDLSGLKPDRDKWQAVFLDLERDCSRLEEQKRQQELALAQLSIHPSDFVTTDPQVEFSQASFEQVQQRLDEVERQLADENKTLENLKQSICKETDDDMSQPWEKIIAHLRAKRSQLLLDYKGKTAEILGKILVCDVIADLRQDEDSKISAGLKSTEVQAPIYQLTGRYKNIKLVGEGLVVSDAVNDFSISDLSTGAQEQVLLALRIGFSTKVMRGEPSFLILDDAFQYSDYKRRKLLVNKMAELAQAGWQIIYFSMDDNIRTLFDRKGKSFGEEYRLINLNFKQPGAKQLDMLGMA